MAEVNDKVAAALKRLDEKMAKEQIESKPLEVELGSDIDFTKVHIEPGSEHLYRRAKRENGQWRVTLTEWLTATRGVSDTTCGKMGKDETPLNLGEYMTFMEQSPEGWHVFNVLPNGSGLGTVIFKRVMSYPLPEPVPVSVVEELDAPTPEKIGEHEAKAAEWAHEQGIDIHDE